MSETWTSLLSGVVGAIVGGAASLAGTMVVNKRQMATNARMRLYDQLLPELEGAIDDRTGVAEERVPELLAAVRRASAVAGRLERQDAHNLSRLWGEHQAETDVENKAWQEEIKTLGPPEAVNADPDPPPGLRQSRGLHQMSEHAYRWNLASALDRRGRVASAHDVGPSDEWDESRL